MYYAAFRYVSLGTSAAEPRLALPLIYRWKSSKKILDHTFIMFENEGIGMKGYVSLIC